MTAVSYFTRDDADAAPIATSPSATTSASKAIPASYIVGTGVDARPGVQKAPGSMVTMGAGRRRFCSFDFHQWQGADQRVSSAPTSYAQRRIRSDQPHHAVRRVARLAHCAATASQSPAFRDSAAVSDRAGEPRRQSVPSSRAAHRPRARRGRTARRATRSTTTRCASSPASRATSRTSATGTMFESWEWEISASVEPEPLPSSRSPTRCARRCRWRSTAAPIRPTCRTATTRSIRRSLGTGTPNSRR